MPVLLAGPTIAVPPAPTSGQVPGGGGHADRGSFSCAASLAKQGGYMGIDGGVFLSWHPPAKIFKIF